MTKEKLIFNGHVVTLLIIGCLISPGSFAQDIPKPEWNIIQPTPAVMLFTKRDINVSNKELSEYQVICSEVSRGKFRESIQKYEICQQVLNKRNSRLTPVEQNLALNLCSALTNWNQYALCHKFNSH